MIQIRIIACHANSSIWNKNKKELFYYWLLSAVAKSKVQLIFDRNYRYRKPKTFGKQQFALTPCQREIWNQYLQHARPTPIHLSFISLLGAPLIRPTSCQSTHKLCKFVRQTRVELYQLSFCNHQSIYAISTCQLPVRIRVRVRVCVCVFVCVRHDIHKAVLWQVIVSETSTNNGTNICNARRSRK